MSITVTVNGQAGPNVAATTGDQVAVAVGASSSSYTVNVSQAGTPGGQGPQGPAGPSVPLSDATPQPAGTAAAGSSSSGSRADHVHAVPVIDYGTLSGVPSQFTPAVHQHAVSDVSGLQSALDGKQASGDYAPLVNGLVPSANLPGFVDDVIDVGGTLPASGDVGKLYVVSTGPNTNKIYRWSGLTFVEIVASPGSTDAVPEGSTNLYHTTQRAAAAAPVQSVAGRTGAVTLTTSDVGLGSVPNVDATKRANHTGTQAISTVDGLQAALDGKQASGSYAASSHLHAIADVTGLQASLDARLTSAVTSLNSLSGAVTLEQGDGVSISASGSKLTISATGGGGGGNYTLPTASASVLGGIKIGSGLTIDGNGVVTASGGGSSSSIVSAATVAGFPATGSAGSTIYIATDTRRIYGWDSSGVYIELGN